MQLKFINYRYIYLYFMFFVSRKPVSKVHQITQKIA